jgi:short/branched chain acyl-CoA dehydrogenase
MEEAASCKRWRSRVRAVMATLPAVADDAYPLDAVRRLLALGVQRVPFDATLGGEGLGVRGLAAVLEEMAAVDGSLAAIAMGMYSANALLAQCATAQQREAALAPLLAGDGLAAVAVTEPEAGTDVAAVRTTCRQRPDGTWRLDGEKAFISNTGHDLWRLTIVLARGPAADRHTAFLVPTATPGLTVERSRATIGWRRVGVHDLRLSGVVLPDEGLRLVLAAFDRGRVAVAALASGLCRGAWQDADAYARERHTFGEPLIAHQAVADELVALWRLYGRAHLATTQAAEAADRGLPLGPWAALAKWEATDAAVQAARLGAQVLGGRGLLQGTKAAARWDDAKTLEVVEGTTEALALVLRRRLQKDGLPAASGDEGGTTDADS